MKKIYSLKHMLLLSLICGTMSAAQASTELNKQELAAITATGLAANTPIKSPQDQQYFLHRYEIVNKELSKYRVTGWSLCSDINFAFIFETQNPEFWVEFKDQNGNRKSKLFRAEINTFGCKFELAFKIDCIFLVNTDSNFYNIEKPIRLGIGIDANIAAVAGLGFTYVPFSNIPGGMIIIGIPFFFTWPSLSLVTGGTLTPIA